MPALGIGQIHRKRSFSAPGGRAKCVVFTHSWREIHACASPRLLGSLESYTPLELPIEARSLYMFGWAAIFFIIAIIAALFGFGGIAGTAAGIAVILFWVALALFVLSLLVSLLSRR